MTSSYLPYTADSYGLFLPSEDLSRGMWLQPGRTLEYYGLKTGVSVSLPHVSHIGGQERIRTGG